MAGAAGVGGAIVPSLAEWEYKQEEDNAPVLRQKREENCASVSIPRALFVPLLPVAAASR